MKNSISLYSLWILFLAISCSNEQNQKSKIIQYSMPSTEEIEAPLDENNLIVKPKTVALKKELPPPPIPPNEILYSVCENYPEPPPPPEPEPEPVVFIPEETMEEKWQKIVRLPKEQIRWQDLEFCFNYGDTLVQQERYEEALVLYEEVKEFSRGYTGKAYFNIAKIYALEGKSHYDIADCLEKLAYSGKKDYKGLLYDPAFEDFRKWNRFSYYYKNIFGSNKKAMFEAFIAFAPKKNLTENFDLSPVHLFEDIEARRTAYPEHHNKHPAIYNYYDAFAEEADYNSFSRGGHDDCRYEMCLLGTKNYFAVIYSVEESWSEYILPKKYYLVTYDLQGNKISKLEIANRGSLKTCKGFVLHPDKTLVVTDYKVKWKAGAKKVWEKHDFMNYKQLKKTIAKSTQSYQITETGRLVEKMDLLVLDKKS